QKLAHRALRDRLAEFEHTARKPPAAGHRRVGATHDKSTVAAHHNSQHPDNRALRVAAALFAEGTRGPPLGGPHPDPPPLAGEGGRSLPRERGRVRVGAHSAATAFSV